MSQQSSATSNTPAEPVLCKMGCGFFVSNEIKQLRIDHFLVIAVSPLFFSSS